MAPVHGSRVMVRRNRARNAATTATQARSVGFYASGHSAHKALQFSSWDQYVETPCLCTNDHGVLEAVLAARSAPPSGRKHVPGLLEGGSFSKCATERP